MSESQLWTEFSLEHTFYTTEPSVETTISDATTAKRVLINEPTEIPTKEEKNHSENAHADDDNDSGSTTSFASNESESDNEIFVDKAIFSEWGCHYQFRQPFSDADKPATKIFDYSKFVLNDMEIEGVLTDRIVASCLSYLDKSPYINKYVMCKCVLANKVGNQNNNLLLV